jgi:cellulose biosynthesis protein BcsQ
VLQRVAQPPNIIGAARRPKLLMVFAPKGGVGKTMLATNMLVAAARTGLSVAGLDFDGQRAFATWGRDRLDHPVAAERLPLEVKSAHLEDWRSELHLVRAKDLVVIDTPPGVEKSSQVSLEELGEEANVILMPTEVYGGSLRYVVDFMTWWDRKQGHALFVLNKTISGRSMTREARELLKEKGEVWEDSIPLRDDIARAFDCGLAAADDDAIAGHSNFLALWAVCANKLKIEA